MIRAVFVTSLQEMSRRLTALVFILLLPLAFYLVRIDVHWQAIRFLSIGIGWAVATLSLFTFIAARDLDRRLVVAGASPSSLFAGRLTAVLAVGLGLAVIYFGVVALTLDDLPRVWSVLLLLVVTVLIGAPLGAVVSLVIVRELEGALALLALMAGQLLVDPDSSYAGFMPLWSTRELTGYALDAPTANSLSDGLGHFAVTMVLCSLVAWGSSVLRLRTRRFEPIPGFPGTSSR